MELLLFLRSSVAFLLIASASYVVGVTGKKTIGMPVITGNLIVGAIAGPYVTGERLADPTRSGSRSLASRRLTPPVPLPAQAASTRSSYGA